ncbi:TetR family transcriptional regulator [Nakamurella sp.]|uniref:TetR/AcrR family transcriptional regulator n=1 Tax=Nakamurella sp. TaxID=1869182 RepID=UPI003783250D
MSAPRTSRDEQRERTRARIAEAAGRRFAADGYDRTTIRGVAADAQVDPALVMHYFGSKRDLFAAAVRLPTDSDPEMPGGADPTALVLASLAVKLGGMNDRTLAGLRSMLTHPDATVRARAALEDESRRLADRLTGDQADTRAALLLAINLGVTIAREIVELDALRACPPEELLDLAAPAVRALTDPPGPAGRASRGSTGD